MAYFAKPLPQGATFIPCRGNQPLLMVRAASFREVQVPTLCGHSAWANEIITTTDGRIIHRMTHLERTVQNGILARIAPKYFERNVPKAVWCTRCDLEEKLEGATICGWCQNIIFPEDTVALTHDDSRIVNINAHRTLCAWDSRIVVCSRKDCAGRVQDQLAEQDPHRIEMGTWYHRYAIIVSPR